MWAANHRPPRAHPAQALKQQAAAAVEFAVVVIFFLTLLFGVLEMARLVFLFNTLQEVARRAAALAVNSAFDTGAQENIRKRALLTDAEGNPGNPLPLIICGPSIYPYRGAALVRLRSKKSLPCLHARRRTG